MEEQSHSWKLVRSLLESQRFAVLATVGEGEPHASLVAYASTVDLRQIVFATGRKTRKFESIRSSGRAAMLMDDRRNDATDIGKSVAVTASGRAREVQGQEREEQAEALLAKHPGLKDFLQEPDTAVVVLDVAEYLVSGFRDTVRLQIENA